MSDACVGLFPGLWPAEAPRYHPPASEAKVYAALRQGLPPGWYAWHALRLRTPDGDFGEADFVIADPARPGVLVLEVKGGVMELFNGTWRQNGRPLRQAPLAQALGFRKKLIACLQEALERYPFVGAAVCFPDTSFDRPPAQSDLAGLVLGQEDLPYLAQRLPRVMERAAPRPLEASGPWLAELHRLWGDCWVPEITLGGRAQIDRQRRLRLDGDQLALLDMLAGNPRLLVSGVAGSGKTLLAMEAARRHARQGKRVLLLCYTDALARELARELDEPRVTVAPVRRFAVGLLRQAGRPVEDEGSPAFWDEVSLRAVDEALPPPDEGWDVVLVDEGQDLGEADWLLVRECAAQGWLWVFADQDQAFWPSRRMPPDLVQTMPRFNLPRPYRCPPAIQHLVECYAGACRPDDSLLRRAAGEGVLGVVTSSSPKLAKQVGKEVNRLVSSGVKPGEIAVLSLRGREAKDNIMHLERLGDHATVEATHPQAHQQVVADSFLRFKGLERPAVVVTDLRLVSSRYEQRMHIAASRALSLLRVVGAEEDIRRDPRLAVLAD